MVHIGCGADVIRQRRRNEQLRKENEAKGIYTIPPDFKPARNKKYPHYTPARNAQIFSNRQLLSFEKKRTLIEQRRAKLIRQYSDIVGNRPQLQRQDAIIHKRLSDPVLARLKPSSSVTTSSESSSQTSSNNQSPIPKKPKKLGLIGKQKSIDIPEERRTKVKAQVHFEQVDDDDDDPCLIQDATSYLDLAWHVDHLARFESWNDLTLELQKIKCDKQFAQDHHDDAGEASKECSSTKKKKQQHKR